MLNDAYNEGVQNASSETVRKDKTVELVVSKKEVATNDLIIAQTLLAEKTKYLDKQDMALREAIEATNVEKEKRIEDSRATCAVLSSALDKLLVDQAAHAKALDAEKEKRLTAHANTLDTEKEKRLMEQASFFQAVTVEKDKRLESLEAGSKEQSKEKEKQITEMRQSYSDNMASFMRQSEINQKYNLKMMKAMRGVR